MLLSKFRDQNNADLKKGLRIELDKHRCQFSKFRKGLGIVSDRSQHVITESLLAWVNRIYSAKTELKWQLLATELNERTWKYAPTT